MNVFISGLLNIETTIKVKKFPIEYFPIDYPFFGIHSSVSGVGYNLAKAFSSLGDDVNLFSYIGQDIEGEIISKKLREDGIMSANIFPELKSTPVSAVLFDEEGKRQIYCDLKDVQEQRAGYEKISNLEDNDLFVICNTNFNRELLPKIADGKNIIATDVHVLSRIDDDYNRDFMKYSDILFLSDENLPSDPVTFIKELRNVYGNKIIVVGMGNKGALLYDERGNIYRFDAVSCDQVVNTVGAGDALFSSFLHFYKKGLNAYDSLIRAEIFAAIKIGTNGAAQGFSDEETIEKSVADKMPKIRPV